MKILISFLITSYQWTIMPRFQSVIKLKTYRLKIYNLLSLLWYWHTSGINDNRHYEVHTCRYDFNFQVHHKYANSCVISALYEAICWGQAHNGCSLAQMRSRFNVSVMRSEMECERESLSGWVGILKCLLSNLRGRVAYLGENLLGSGVKRNRKNWKEGAEEDEHE